MNYEISIPLTIALFAFFIADDEGSIGAFLAKKSFKIEDKTSVCDRLAQLGKTSNYAYENFRLAQMTLIVIGQVLLTALLIFQFLSIPTFLLLSVVSAAGVVLAMEKNLSSRCSKRMSDIEREFPALIEMLTLAVGAGESPISALRLISTRATGYLSLEFARAIEDIERGISLSSALDSMSRRVNSTEIRRFVDSLIISISRGTSLVETLTHSVNESRNQERVRLLTAAGKSEVSMMIPVVFLILPISILFALFPSITNLNLFGG